MFPVSPRPPASLDPPGPPSRAQAVPPEPASGDDERFRTLDRLDLRFEDFLEYTRTGLGHADASRRWYRCAYQNFRTFLIERGAAFGGDIRPNLFAIAEWVRWNREKRRTPVTLLNYYRGLEVFFRDLEARDGIPSPFRGERTPAAPKRAPKARTPEECRRILDAARNVPWPSPFHRARVVAMLGCMIYAGLRKGEVLRLQFEHVNLGDSTLRIERGKGRFGGKDRMAYMPAELAILLREYVRERARLRLETPEFFCGLKGRGLSDSTLRRIIARVRRASGVPFSMHSLRHSFVTMLLKSGVPLHVASELAGHNDIGTTAAYLRVFDDEKRTEARRLRLFGTR
jgi:integrase